MGWVFFRTAGLGQSVYVLRQMFTWPSSNMLFVRWQLWAAAILLLLALLEERWCWFDRLVQAPAWVYASALAIFLFCLETMGYTGDAKPFIYFQF